MFAAPKPPQSLAGTLLASLVRNAVERFRNASALRLSNELLAVLAGDRLRFTG